MKPSACFGLFLMYGVPLLLMGYANYAGSFAAAWFSLLWMIMVSFLIIILSGDSDQPRPSMDDMDIKLTDAEAAHFRAQIRHFRNTGETIQTKVVDRDGNEQ